MNGSFNPFLLLLCFATGAGILAFMDEQMTIAGVESPQALALFNPYRQAPAPRQAPVVSPGAVAAGAGGAGGATAPAATRTLPRASWDNWLVLGEGMHPDGCFFKPVPLPGEQDGTVIASADWDPSLKVSVLIQGGAVHCVEFLIGGQ